MAEAIYSLCALTSIACAVLLLKHYLARRTALLLWSSICFVLLAVNNILLFLDRVVVPDVNLSLWRSGVAAVGLFILLYGLIWEGR